MPQFPAMTDAVVPAQGLDADDSAVHLTYRMTSRDLGKATMQAVSFSVGSNAIGAFLVATSLIGILNGDLLSVAALLLGLAILTGLYCVPFVLWATRRRADLLLAEQNLAIDGWGVRSSTLVASSQQAWPTFRRVRELTDGFMLDYGTGAAALVPKHAFDAVSIERFREFALGAGKLDASPAWEARVKGIVIGAGVAVGLFLVIVVANARN
jgi:hypothetical protein